MGRRILNRKDLRADYDAAERRKGDEEEEEEQEEAEEEEDEEESDAGEEDEEEAEAAGGGDEEEEEEAPKKKKKVAKPRVTKAKPRSRAAKIVRMRVVWGVYSNSNQLVATYEYPKKDDAVAHANRLTADKRSTHFVQPIKEPMEEKKEKEK